MNTIAPSATLLYEFRSDRKENFAQMESQFRTACKNVTECDLTVEAIGIRPCGDVDPDLQEALAKRCEAAFAGLPTPRRHPASTDCNLPLSMGIPAVCIGLCYGGGAHTAEEYILPGSISAGTQVLERLLKSYL